MQQIVDNLLIGVAGSVYATSLLNIIQKINIQIANNIRVIMSDMGKQMISPQILSLYAEVPPYTSPWDTHAVSGAPHIYLSNWADVFIVLPATANTISKAACGIADNLLLTSLLAYEGSVLFAPVMNRAMWSNAAVQKNITTLKSYGHIVIPPETIESVTQVNDRTQHAFGPSIAAVLKYLRYAATRKARGDLVTR